MRVNDLSCKKFAMSLLSDGSAVYMSMPSIFMPFAEAKKRTLTAVSG